MPKSKGSLETYRQSLEIQLQGYRAELELNLHNKAVEYAKELQDNLNERLGVSHDWPFELKLNLTLNLTMDIVNK